MVVHGSHRGRVHHQCAHVFQCTHEVVHIRSPVTLVVVLSRSRTGIRKTDTILNRFIRGAIQTGLFASIFALGNLICFVVLPETNFYGMFAIPIGRIYTNTLLDTLLCRELLNAVTDGVENVSVVVSCLATITWLPLISNPCPDGFSVLGTH